MALSKNVVEPLVVVGLFTAGALASRRRDSSGSKHDVELGWRQRRRRRAANGVMELLARFWVKFPFLEEIWYWLLTYWVYQLLRAASAVRIAGNEAVFETARRHAEQILRMESALGVAFERGFQSYVLSRQAWAVPWLARVYYAHICVGVGFLAYAYTYCPRDAYVRVRRTLALDNAVAFVVLSLWRCSPPRFLSGEEYGFVDVLHGGVAALAGSGTAWTHNRFQLTIAAMPSLHFGTALLLGLWLARYSPHGIVRVAAPLWPALMLPTIVATANHFLADALVGALIPCLGWRYAHLVGRLAPLQERVFRPVREAMGLEGGGHGRAVSGSGREAKGATLD